MKNSFNILFIFLSCLATSTCYGVGGHVPLWLYQLKKRESLKQDNLVTKSLESKEEFGVFVGPREGRREGDKIIKLPGQLTVKFSQYSGYVTVDPKADRELFYYFAEAENPNEKPLVLWLNGGPGCSSMGYGAMTEIGPFRVNPDGETLSYNQYAWNKVANVLFMETPAGVGFSYSKNLSDYNDPNDKKTAADSYTFLVNWLKRFPEYKSRDLFIAGESYAGHYIPQLAELILSKNKNTTHIVIRLKGIVLGNALLDDSDFFAGEYNYWWSHALISDETHSRINRYCNSSSPEANRTRCSQNVDTAKKEMGNIDPYDIYAPLCLNSSGAVTPGMSSASFDPCSENYVHTYLNRNEVQKALHADVSGETRPWEICNDNINENWTEWPPTVIPVVKKLMRSGIRVLIYSGDTDGIVPVTATKYSLPKLGAKVETPWYPWYYENEVGGYAVGYDHNLTFVTIREAGHMVPSYQPGRALAMFTSFLQGKLPPQSSCIVVRRTDRL